MAGAIMEKVFDLFRMDPAEDREDDKEEYGRSSRGLCQEDGEL